MKIVGYIRVSTEKQDVERQKMLIEKWAMTNNHTVVNYVEDFGISGEKGVEARAGFASRFELNNDICDIVVISEFSRYSREESTLSVMNSMLDIVNRGIEIFILNTNKFIRKGFDSDLISIITLAVESKAAWDERSQIRERMSSGKIQKNLDKPQSIGGKSIIYGYKLFDKII